MKKFLKLACIAMSIGMACSMAACGGNEPGEGPGGTKPSGSNGVIKVHYSAGGFGKEWMNSLAKDYKALTGVSISWVPSYTTGEIQSLLVTGQEKNDIVMPLLNMYQAQDAHRLEDLTDVYESTCEGETVAIKDKMNQSLYTYIEADDGKRYQMFGSNSVSAFCYNVGTLNAAFGEGKWELPRTTNELVSMAGQLKSKGYYTLATSTNINYYWDYMGTVWWAQYDGLEAYNKFYEGQYWDATANEWKLGPQINDTLGRRYSLETLGTLLKSSNGYIHQYSNRMGFEEAQGAFLSNGYGGDNKKVAFMVNGDWLENEMASWLLTNPQDIRMMRAPVISQLTEKLSTVDTDEKLSAVVEAIDNGETEYAGVSAEDFATVRNARLMGYTATPNYPIGIPANRPEKQKQLAKDFLVYLYSDRAQKLYAKELLGLTMPAGYDVLADEGNNVSDFVRSRILAFGNDMVPVFPNNSSVMVYRGGLAELPGIGTTADKKLFEGTTASSLLATSKTTMEFNWKEYIKYLPTSGNN